MNNRQLKCLLIATMCPIGTPLKVQEHTKKTLDDNANIILDLCGLSLNEESPIMLKLSDEVIYGSDEESGMTMQDVVKKLAKHPKAK